MLKICFANKTKNDVNKRYYNGEGVSENGNRRTRYERGGVKREGTGRPKFKKRERGG